jgi:predicted DCC family thiol-disulfide oxidoreductase YuxK
MAKTKVYYNSACPVCDAGIRYQRARLEGCGVEVEWIDVRENNQVVEDLGADLEQVRERLHLVDETGAVRVGAEAFAELWRRTPGQGWLAVLARLPIVRTGFRWAYNGFARVLYRWNRRKGHW